MIDLLASGSHLVDHLEPIWWSLGRLGRGDFIGTTPAARRRATQLGIRVQARRGNPRRAVIVASYHDVRQPGPVVYLEHGAGQCYGGEPPEGAKADVDERCPVVLFLCPSERVARRNRIHHPHAASVAIGCPKLDDLHRAQVVHKLGTSSQAPTSSGLVVAFTWHHPSDLAPEAMWSWPEWRSAVIDLARIRDSGIRVLGHAHPRVANKLGPWWRRWNLPFTDDWSEVLERADVLCVDNSSLAYEFMSIDKPVVWLNSVGYRREVEHGMRFWQHADAGLSPTIGDVEALRLAIEASATRDPCAGRRREVVDDVYLACDGKATQRALEAIERTFQ